MFAKAVSCVSLGLILLTASAVSAFAAETTLYKFAPNHVAPLMALQEAAKLINERHATVVSQPELDMFKKVAAGQSNECDVTDSVLIASGINDPQKRQKYAEKIDKIVDDAGQAISRFDSQEQKAKALAKYLHKVPLHGGYVSLQGNMALLLNEGTYNCVSSAILYYVVAARLGIKTQPEQAPDHVFLQMGDMVIEPTGGKTESTDDHQKFIDKLWAEAKPTDPLIYGDKQYRRTNKMGLIGEVYIDAASKAKGTFDQSTVMTLKACCMCPTNPLYANRAGSKLHSWAIEAIKAKDLAKAQKIAAIAGQLYGDSVSSDLFKQIASKQKRGR